jgi:uncharacterized protein YndB with AHSA1/START domain
VTVTATDAITKVIHVNATPETAFRVFTEQIGDWWPLEHYSVLEGVQTVVFEDDRIVERAADGSESVWGEILDFEVAGRLRFTWHPGRDDADPTEVEVTFAADGDGTVVTLVHSGWEQLSEERRAGRADYENGWPGVLDRFRQAAEGN